MSLRIKRELFGTSGGGDCFFFFYIRLLGCVSSENHHDRTLEWKKILNLLSSDGWGVKIVTFLGPLSELDFVECRGAKRDDCIVKLQIKKLNYDFLRAVLPGAGDHRDKACRCQF